MTAWEENHAGITARVGGRYRMKHHQEILEVVTVKDGKLTYRRAEKAQDDPITGYLPVETFERQIESELP